VHNFERNRSRPKLAFYKVSCRRRARDISDKHVHFLTPADEFNPSSNINVTTEFAKQLSDEILKIAPVGRTPVEYCDVHGLWA